MKKLLLIPALFATISMADNYKYEISPMIGYNFAEGNLGLKNDGYLTGGLEFQVNSSKTNLSPEFSIYYAPNVDYKTTGSTDVARAAFNGVYTFNRGTTFTPFAKMGLGLENFTTNKDGNNDRLFFDAGAGAKVSLTKNLAVKLEAIYMLKPSTYHAGNADSNLMTLVGLTYSFGAEAQKTKKAPKDSDNDGVLDTNDKCANTPAGTTVDASGCKVVLDSDNDGVLDTNDKCANTPAGTTVDANGCKVVLDSDNDGVLDTNDKCANTPAGTTVDANGCKVVLDSDNDGVLDTNDKCANTPAGIKVDTNGCPATLTFDITFDNNSAKINPVSNKVLNKYADFLTTNSIYHATIVGYTDSVGNAKYNKKLSLNRAKSVVKALEERGVNKSQLSAEGMGEANPVADNTTEAGRAKNRRIEAKLTTK